MAFGRIGPAKPGKAAVPASWSSLPVSAPPGRLREAGQAPVAPGPGGRGPTGRACGPASAALSDPRAARPRAPPRAPGRTRGPASGSGCGGRGGPCTSPAACPAGTRRHGPRRPSGAREGPSSRGSRGRSRRPRRSGSAARGRRFLPLGGSGSKSGGRPQGGPAGCQEGRPAPGGRAAFEGLLEEPARRRGGEPPVPVQGSTARRRWSAATSWNWRIRPEGKRTVTLAAVAAGPRPNWSTGESWLKRPRPA